MAIKLQKTTCLFLLVSTIRSLNFQFRPLTPPTNHHIQQPLKTQQPIPQPSNSQQPDESDQIYGSFVENLLQNQQFTTSLLQSVSNVFYNHWITKLSSQNQKKYMKILLTTVRNDQRTQMTQDENFEMLRKILEEPQMAKEFLKYMEFDFDKKQFKQFIVKYYPEEKGNDFGTLSDSEKAKIYLIALQKQDELEKKIKQKDQNKEQQFETDLTLKDQKKPQQKTQHQQKTSIK